ncbi:MAG: Ig-like domain-containing protein, partial [Treponema sp.]|nr:Ig-like domain-containing protein [Treponema sp.]
GDSAAAPVKVAGIKLGVQGASPGAVSGTGTSDSPATYIARQSETTSGIQLVPEVIPSYADNTAVKYYLSPTHTNDTTISVQDTTGLVTVTGTGSATIQAISQDIAEPEFYLTIIITPDYVPVGDFNIVAPSTAMLVLGEIALSTDIPATVTGPEVTWTSDDSTTIAFVSGEAITASVTGLTARIKGLKAGTATITATAVTTNSGTPTTKIATQLFTVNSTAGAKLEWKFDTLPDGWTANTNTAAGIPDVDYNGLTLTTSTRTMKMLPADTAGSTDFSPGYLQPGGGNKFAALSDVQGPFTIKLNYCGAGATDRYPGITISNQPKITTAPPSTGTSDFKTFEYNYTGTDEVDIEFTSEGNAIRLYDLIIQF